MTVFSCSKIDGPDGVEAWTVAFAACVINFIMAGIGRMSGILYVAFLDIFQVDRRAASLPFSVRASMRNLLGPVVGILGQKYGTRAVVITGAIIGSMSSAVCFSANDMLWITVLWGGISGFGAAMTTTLNQAIVGQHFSKYRTTAAGMAFSGGCVGSFLFPVLMEYLIQTYGLNGTFLLISGILMNVIPASLVLKSPSWKKAEASQIQVSTIGGDVEKILKDNAEKTKSADRTDVCEDTARQNNCLGDKQRKDLRPIDANGSVYDNGSIYNKKCDTDFLWKNRKLVLSLLTNDFTLKYPTSENFQNKLLSNSTSIQEIEDLFQKMFLEEHNITSLKSCESKDNVGVGIPFTNQLLKTYVTESNNTSYFCSKNYLSYLLHNLFEKSGNTIVETFSGKNDPNLPEILTELKNIHILIGKSTNMSPLSSRNSILIHSNKNIETNFKRSNSFYSHIKTALKLYSKPIFVLICLCRAAHFMTFMPILTTVVDFSIDKGLPEEDGKFVIACLSLGDLLGRLCLGWITDRGYITLPRYMLCAMVVQAAFTTLLSFMESKATLLTAVAIFGMFQGSIFVRHPVLVSRYLESHEQSIAMGCLNFFSGLLAFVMPSYIGYFRDIIGSYNGMLYISGAVGASIGFLWIFEPFLVKLSKAGVKANFQTN